MQVKKYSANEVGIRKQSEEETMPRNKGETKFTLFLSPEEMTVSSFFFKGLITVAKILDREQQERFAMTVIATDSESLEGVTSVIISVLDMNDNSPRFSVDAYRFSTSEDSSVNSVVGVVSAVDADLGQNGTVTYSIVAGNTSECIYVSL